MDHMEEFSMDQIILQLEWFNLELLPIGLTYNNAMEASKPPYLKELLMLTR